METSAIQALLDQLLQLPEYAIWMLFLAENILITVSVLMIGHVLLQRFSSEPVKAYRYTLREWLICAVTNILNTLVTYAGFWLWKGGHLIMDMSASLFLIYDFVILFLAMDLLMYIFHYAIHKTFLYKAMHGLHHKAVDPKPIDLFILHPVETLCFGGLWLILLLLYPFNVYAIILYLTVNVIFGMAGHLGIEPLSEKMRGNAFLKYFGTSTFHHQHHQNVQHNFGFYTTLWDRLFGTLQKP
jgi:sterol desaturase/sphingolipid hydroxylase (fatty acid hydroxylase superfamily)